LFFLRKSGKKNDGKAYFYNGVAGKPEQGWEIYMISIVEIESPLSYSLSVQQTPSRHQIKPVKKLPQNPNLCPKTLHSYWSICWHIFNIASPSKIIKYWRC